MKIGGVTASFFETSVRSRIHFVRRKSFFKRCQLRRGRHGRINDGTVVVRFLQPPDEAIHDEVMDVDHGDCEHDARRRREAGEDVRARKPLK